MKKLFMMLGMVAVMAFSAGTASAVSFGIDIGANGSIDSPAEVTIDVGSTIEIDLYLVDWASVANPGSNLGALDYRFNYDTDQFQAVDEVADISCKDLKPAGSALWDSEGRFPDGDYVDLSVIEFGVGVSGSPIRLHTVVLECKALGDGDISVDSGYAVDVLGDDSTPVTPATGIVHQTEPACGCAADSGDGEVRDSDLDEQCNVITLNPGFCSATPDYVWTDDCAGGDVDPDTGLFSAVFPIPPAGESCTITCSDSANPGVACTAPMELVGIPPCSIEVYEGGAPVPPCNTYSKPGRRGLMLTCGDTVDFSECTDCECLDVSWSLAVVSGTPPAGTSLDPVTGLLTIGPDCTDLDAPAVLAVTVECETLVVTVSDTIEISVGEVILSVLDKKVSPDDNATEATVAMANPNHAVKAIEVDLVDVGDCLTCTGCNADPDRALDYTCSANEQADGSCKVVLATFNPAGLIEEGSGDIFTVDYVGDCPGCVIITAGTTVNVADRFGDPLCACFEDGEICEFACGDIYPRECLPLDPECGDGVVDIFDILEEIDFILNVIDPSLCQEGRADVPTGTPPYCGCVGDEICQTDGVIDIFDLLVIIDMALGKANCCDYCASGAIY
jgi:hypothetical protein